MTTETAHAPSTTTHAPLPKLLSYADVAREYGLKLGTLYSMVQKQTIPHTRIGPRLVRFDRDLLDHWLASNTIAAKVG